LTVRIIDDAGETITTSTVNFVSPSVDTGTQSVLVKATLRQMPPGIRVMQYVRARVIWNNDPVLTVPVVAVNRVAGQYFVFVAETGQGGTVARQRPVTLGAVYQNRVVVTDGLEAGHRLVVVGQRLVDQGSRVRLVNAASKAAQ